MHIDDSPFNILNRVVMRPVGKPRAEPREELPQCALVVRPRLCQSLARDLHIQILCPCQPQRGGQIDRMYLLVRRRREVGNGAAHQQGPRQYLPHFVSVTFTGCPSANVRLPSTITGIPDPSPLRISTCFPSLKPIFTGTFFALLSTTVNTDALAFSISTASAGTSKASTFRSMPIFAVAYIPGRSSSF